MNQFDGQLIIRPDAQASKELGGSYYRVMRSFRFYLPTSDIANEWTCYDTDRWAFVPAGTLTDLGSIPGIFRGVIDNGGIAAQAYALHDQLCEYLSITNKGAPRRITRQEADIILLDALQALEVDKTTAYLIYNAVAAYAAVMDIRLPSTTMKKRQLESAWNFEGF